MSTAKRSQTTGHLVITMPKASPFRKIKTVQNLWVCQCKHVCMLVSVSNGQLGTCQSNDFYSREFLRFGSTQKKHNSR